MSTENTSSAEPSRKRKAGPASKTGRYLKKKNAMADIIDLDSSNEHVDNVINKLNLEINTESGSAKKRKVIEDESTSRKSNVVKKKAEKGGNS